MYWKALGTALAFLACNQSPTGTGNAVVGTWVTDDPAESNLEIWSIKEDGLFSKFSVFQDDCLISNGRWETSNNITIFPGPSFSTSIRGTYKIEGESLAVIDIKKKEKTLWKRTEESPFDLMAAQGYCMGDPDETN